MCNFYYKILEVVHWIMIQMYASYLLSFFSTLQE